MKLIVIFFLICSLPSGIFSRDKNSVKDSLFFFRSDQIFVPTESSIFESKNGITKFTDKKNLRLDIGVSMDLIGIKNKKITYSLGADFFTFSNLRSESGFKFPVDAIDYLFGLNLNFNKHISPVTEISGRFRISHISSHFEDGHIYERTDTIFTPAVFSKEFIDMAAAVDLSIERNMRIKIMPAVNVIFHSIPDNIPALSGQLGLQCRYFFGDIFSLYVSNDIYISGTESETRLSENLETGISFGEINSHSLKIFFTYYEGFDYKGQYYGKYLNNKGIGARIKF